MQCYANCLTCSGTSINQCLTCDTSSFFLSSQCYTSCPSYYRQNTTTRVCDACTPYCLTCTAFAAVCTQCQPTYFLFRYNASYVTCVQSCPNYYYQIGQACFPCLSPCNLCTAAYVCIDCIVNYYLNTKCYPCSSTCQVCTGPTALNCTTCISGYFMSGGVCKKLSCNSSQYVNSAKGCVSCLTTYANSATCSSTGIITCNSGYILSNKICQGCSSVVGYTLDSTTNLCKDLCGDGIIITDPCDDGNTLNGDGCSSSCTI